MDNRHSQTDNGWYEYKKLVLSELSELKEGQKELIAVVSTLKDDVRAEIISVDRRVTNQINSVDAKVAEQVNKIDNRVTTVETKCMFLASIAGAVVALIPKIIELIF